jgi:hypothetical protein
LQSTILSVSTGYREDVKEGERFARLGGCTKGVQSNVVNPKALVIENDPAREEEIRYNPHALLVAKHLGTELNIMVPL